MMAQSAKGQGGKEQPSDVGLLMLMAVLMFEASHDGQLQNSENTRTMDSQLLKGDLFAQTHTDKLG